MFSYKQKNTENNSSQSKIKNVKSLFLKWFETKKKQQLKFKMLKSVRRTFLKYTKELSFLVAASSLLVVFYKPIKLIYFDSASEQFNEGIYTNSQNNIYSIVNLNSYLRS